MKSQNIEIIFGVVEKMTKNSVRIPDSGLSVLNGLMVWQWKPRITVYRICFVSLKIIAWDILLILSLFRF